MAPRGVNRGTDALQQNIGPTLVLASLQIQEFHKLFRVMVALQAPREQGGGWATAVN